MGIYGKAHRLATVQQCQMNLYIQMFVDNSSAFDQDLDTLYCSKMISEDTDMFILSKTYLKYLIKGHTC